MFEYVVSMNNEHGKFIILCIQNQHMSIVLLFYSELKAEGFFNSFDIL